MSGRSDLGFGALSRREFISASVALTVLPTITQKNSKPFHNAIFDPSITRDLANYRRGDETMDAVLARPKDGKHPVVMVVAGNVITEEYISNTVCLLAQAGFVGIAPNIFRYQTERMTPQEKVEVFRNKITDDAIFQDLEATMRFLKDQPYVADGKAGVMGFCFGGRIALMYAARSKEIGAVVPYYGNLLAPKEANRQVDPVNVVKDIHAPVQGHYSTRDAGIPLDQLHRFSAALHANKTPVEMFEYNVDHGFFAYTRPSFDLPASELAWHRTVEFLRRNLNS